MSVSVVYLAYYNESAGYGLDSVKDFLYSHLQYSAGMEHSLKIIAKNWTDKDRYNDLKTLADGFNAEVIDLPDDGWDLGAYFRAAKLIKSEYLFFMGTSTKFEANNWLINFYNAFNNNEKVQLAGSMGSWEDPKYNVFPNFHIRTTNFMIRRDLFLEYANSVKFPVTKWDTYQLEHGEISLTKYVLKKGYTAVLVNSEGKTFEPEDWPFSDTYRLGDQTKLLISDKQAQNYHLISDEYRKVMELFVWGPYFKDKVYVKPDKIENFVKTEVDIFVSSTNKALIFNDLCYHPIYNGEYDFELEACSYVDYYADNIAQKHFLYGDLTGYYQIWKNFLEKSYIDYIGFCSDRKFFDFQKVASGEKSIKSVLTVEYYNQFKTSHNEKIIMSFVRNYDIVLPEKISLSTNCFQHYKNNFNQSNLDVTIEALEKLYPKYKKSADKILARKEIYEHECFIMKKALFGKYMEWLFEILDSVENEIEADKNNKNAIYSLAEILFNIWLEHNGKSFKSGIGKSSIAKLYDSTQEYLNSFYKGSDLLESIQGTALDSDTRVKIFASYYKSAPLIKSNVFEPIFNGASGYAQGLDVLTDDTGDNISEKNKNYGELTQQYWVWKNYMPGANNEYVGFCQHHRFLDFELTENLGKEAYQPILALNFPLEDLLKKYTEENIYNYIKDYDIILPAKIVFGGSNYIQYANCHKKEDLDKALEILARIYPDYSKTAQEVLQEEEMYIYGAFIMKKELLNEYMGWIFNILTELDKVSDWSDYDEYNRRTPAFIAERFLNVWLKHNIETKNLKVKNTTSQLLCENLDLYLKEALFMMERVKVKDIKKAIAEGRTTTAAPVAPAQPEKKPDPQVKIFSVYYQPAPVFESNVFQPIYNGSVNFALPAGVLKDNTGDNISSKNPHWGELTQNYWVWKNYMPTSTSKYIGFCHYRRFLDFNMSKISSEPLFPIFINNFPQMFEMYTEENIMKAIEGYDIVIPNKFDCGGVSVYDQYLAWHPKKDLDLAMEVLNELYPEYMPTAEEFLKSTSMYICFNYVMKKELVNEFFEWIFNILNTLEKRCSWDEYTEYFQIRMPAFLAERFFNIWLDYNIKTRDLKVMNSTNILISYDQQEFTQRCLEKMQKLQVQLAGQTQGK